MLLMHSFCVTDSQQRYEDELMQLRDKLQSISDQHDDSYQSDLQNDKSLSGAGSLENGEHNTDGGQTPKSNGQSETSEHRLHEVLNRELSMFCERMCSSRTGDVSNEQETNERHDVAEGYEGDNEKSEDNSETDSKESEVSSSVVDNGFTLGNEDLRKEVDNLKMKLTDGLIPLLSSSDGKIFNSYM